MHKQIRKQKAFWSKMQQNLNAIIFYGKPFSLHFFMLKMKNFPGGAAPLTPRRGLCPLDPPPHLRRLGRYRGLGALVGNFLAPKIFGLATPLDLVYIFD